jgi:hypothetical protein
VDDVVGGVSLLAVAPLVQAEDKRSSDQRRPQHLQALGTERLHRLLGVGQEIVQRLGVGLCHLDQARQQLAFRFHEQAEAQRGELPEVPQVREQRGRGHNTHQ